MPVEPMLSKYLHSRGRKLGIPVSGTFELTPCCNFNCKMCYVHLSRQEQQARGRELTAQEWISLGRQACDRGMVFLLLTGGEVLIRPDFPEIYQALKKMGLILTVNTNGYLLRGELLELFRQDPPSRVNVTLYGTSNETYERLCGIGAYETVLENVKALRASGIEVRLNMSVTGANRADMEAVYAQAKALGAHVQATAYMFPPTRVTGQFGGGNRLSAGEAAACELAFLRMQLGEEGFHAYAEKLRDGVTAEPTEDCEGIPGPRMACRAGRTSFWIAWDGTLSPCGLLPKPSCSVLNNGFSAAWDAIRRETEEIRLPEACGTCTYRHVCHACAAKCYCETGRFDGKPEYVCELARCQTEQAITCLAQEYGGNKNEDQA